MIAEKKMIHEDVRAFTVQISDLNKYSVYLDNLVSTYQALDIGAFTDDIFKQSISNPEAFRELYREKLETQLDKMGVKIKSMRKSFIDGCQQEIEAFIKAAHELRAFTPPRAHSETAPVLPLSSISFERGAFNVGKNEKERLKEELRMYIETEEEGHLYEQMKAFIPAYESLYEAVNRSGILSRVKNPASHWINLEALFRVHDGKFKVNEGIISAVRNQLKYKK